MDRTTPDKAQNRARIATVIVNYRAAGLIMDRFEPLLAQTRAMEGSRIYIVDNDSPGDDAQKLEAFAASIGDGIVRFVRSGRNGGFAYGNNCGFLAMRRDGFRPDYVFLLNPDAYLREGALAALADFLDAHPKAGVAGAALEDPDGSPRPAAFYFPKIMRELAGAAGLTALTRLFPIIVPYTDEPKRVDWVSGAAMMLRSRLLDEVGGMDDGYFLYFEETDYLLSVRRAGWEVWRAPAARVAHEAGSSTGMRRGKPGEGKMPSYWFDSWLRYYVKNHGLLYARAAAAGRLAGLGLYTAHRRLRGMTPETPEGFAGDFVRSCLLGRAPRIAGEEAAA